MEYRLCSCGKKVAIRLTTCPYCKEGEKTTFEITGNSSNKIFIIVFGGLIAVLACLCVYFIFNKSIGHRQAKDKPSASLVQSMPADDNHSSDYAAYQTSVLMRLAHHVPKDNVKEVGCVKLKSYLRLRTWGSFGEFLPKIENYQESVFQHADNGTYLFALLVKPDGILFSEPTSKLVCMNPDGSVLWQRDDLEKLQQMYPLRDGVLLIAHGSTCLFYSNTGKVQRFPCPPKGAITHTRNITSSDLDYTLTYPNSHNGYDWTRYKGDWSKITPDNMKSATGLNKRVNAGLCSWFTAEYAYAASTTIAYEKVIEEIDLATGATRQIPIYKLEVPSLRRPDFIEPRILGILGHFVVWVEEIPFGLRVHKTSLISKGEEQSIIIKTGATKGMRLQLTMDGKLFYSPYSLDEEKWYFLANVTRMDCIPDPVDTGVQFLWIGHPKRVMTDNGWVFAVKQK